MHRFVLCVLCVAGVGLVPATAPTTRATAATGAAVKLRTDKVGRILVDRKGRTLYLFEKDKGRASTCYGTCAQVWPPALAPAHLSAGRGVKRSLIGTTRRRDGKRELTYAGHPLYRYVSDTRPGQTTGQGLNQFGAKWYVLRASGKKIDKD